MIAFDEIEWIDRTACFDGNAARGESRGWIREFRHRQRFEIRRRRDASATDQVAPLVVPYFFGTEVPMTFSAASGRKVLIDIAIARQNREHTSSVEHHQGRPNECEQSSA